MNLIKSGIAPIDLCLGGFAAGRSHVVSGASGMGKSIACLEFLHAGLSAGERTVLLTHDDPSDVLAQGEFLGIDLQRELEDDRLVLLRYQADFISRFCRAPSSDRAFDELRSLMGEPAPRRIGIDSIGPLLEAGGAAGAGIGSMLQFLDQLGASALITYPGEPSGGYDPKWEPISQRAAAILHFSHEPDGSHRLHVRKARYQVHSMSPIDFRIQPGAGIIGISETPVRAGPVAAKRRHKVLVVRSGGSPSELLGALPPELLDGLHAGADLTVRNGLASAFSDLAHNGSAGGVLIDVRRDTINDALMLVRELRFQGNHAPIILVTSFDLRSNDRARALRAGADDFISGDTHPDEFFLRLDHAMRRGRGIAPTDLVAPLVLQPTEGRSYVPLDDASFRAAVQKHLEGDRCPFFTLVTFAPLNGDVRRLVELAMERMRVDGGDLAGIVQGRVAVYLHSARRKDVAAFIERLQSKWIASGQVDLRVEIGSYPTEERRITRLLEPVSA